MTHVRSFALAVAAQAIITGSAKPLETTLHRGVLAFSMGARTWAEGVPAEEPGEHVGFGLRGHALCQRLEVLLFDPVEALQLRLPPGQTGPTSPHPPREQMPTRVPWEGTSLRLPSATQPLTVEARRKPSNSRIILHVCEDPQH